MPKFVVVKKVITTQTYIFDVEIESSDRSFPTERDRAISATSALPTDAYEEERDIKFQVLSKLPGR